MWLKSCSISEMEYGKIPEERERLTWRADGRIDEIVSNGSVHMEYISGDTYFIRVGGLRLFANDLTFDSIQPGHIPGGGNCIVPRDGLPDDETTAEEIIEKTKDVCTCDQHL